MRTEEGKRIDRAAALEPMDVHLARRLREAREARGWSREKLAKELGMSEQQVYKWEIPANRLFANRIWAAAVALGYPVGWFFDGFRRLASPSITTAAAASGADVMSLLTPEGIRLLEQFNNLSTTQQRLIRQFMQEMTEKSAQPDDKAATSNAGEHRQMFAERVPG